MNKYTGFTTIDPLHQYASPFMGMGNNPVALTDPLGAAVSGGGGNEWVEAAMQDYIYNQIDASTNTFDADYNFLRYGSTGYHSGGGGVPSYQTPNMDRYEAQQQTGADIAMNQIEAGIANLIMLNIMGMDEPEMTYFTFTDEGILLPVYETEFGYFIEVSSTGIEFPDSKSMIDFMYNTSENVRVELAAFIFENINHEHKYFVQPWNKNTYRTSENYPRLLANYINNGYNPVAQVHTHNSDKTWRHIGISKRDMELFHKWGLQNMYVIEIGKIIYGVEQHRMYPLDLWKQPCAPVIDISNFPY